MTNKMNKYIHLFKNEITESDTNCYCKNELCHQHSTLNERKKKILLSEDNQTMVLNFDPCRAAREKFSVPPPLGTNTSSTGSRNSLARPQRGQGCLARPRRPRGGLQRGCENELHAQ